jgi:hypothetical protein
MTAVRLAVAAAVLLAVPALLIGASMPSGITLTSSPNASIYGRPVSLVAVVTPTAASGSVTFYDGAEVLGTATLTGGQAKLTTSLIPSGSRPLTARYSGDTNFAPSTSATLVHEVEAVQGGESLPGVNHGADPNPRSMTAAELNREGRGDLAVGILVNGDVESLLLGLVPASSPAIADIGNLTQRPERKAHLNTFPTFASPEQLAIAGTEQAPATNTGITYVCDPTITALMANACDTLNTVIAAVYSNAFTNMNASIYIKLGSTDLGASAWAVNFFSYGNYRDVLVAKSQDANDVTADTDSVPAANPYGTDEVGVASALQRALGISTAQSGLETDGTTTCTIGTAGCYDGIITMSNATAYYFRVGEISTSQYDFFTIVQHETDEILGTPSCALVGCQGFVFPSDYFRYHSNGTRSFGAGTQDPCSSSDSTNACFSLDGVHMLQQYQNIATGGDGGDWAIDCGSPLVQDEALCPGLAGVDISPAAEILVLDVIGYTLRTPSLAGAVTNVTSSTPNGTYGVGSPISIQITFSEDVTVTGTPLLALNSGGTARYTSGSGTSTLTFAYGVHAGENTSRLDCWSTSALALNGGKIEGSGGTAENLTLPRPGIAGSLGGETNIVIDTSRRSRSEPPEIGQPVKR